MWVLEAVDKKISRDVVTQERTLFFVRVLQGASRPNLNYTQR